VTSSPDDQAGTPGYPGHQDPYDRREHTRPWAEDRQGRPEPGGTQYGQPRYGEQRYGQPRYGEQQCGQQWYAEPGYAPPQHGGRPYGPQSYGPPPGWGPGGYGMPSDGRAVRRPGVVTTSAVLGLVLGALGALLTLGLFLVGAVASGTSAAGDIPGLGALAGAIGGILVVVAVLALAWTVVMIWGAVWALTGRSRVMLLVGGSVALAFTAVGLAGSLTELDSRPASSVVWPLVLFLASLTVVVLLSVPTAGRWFGARRALRGR
jgi:hypothetical protein